MPIYNETKALIAPYNKAERELIGPKPYNKPKLSYSVSVTLWKQSWKEKTPVAENLKIQWKREEIQQFLLDYGDSWSLRREVEERECSRLRSHHEAWSRFPSLPSLFFSLKSYLRNWLALNSSVFFSFFFLNWDYILLCLFCVRWNICKKFWTYTFTIGQRRVDNHSGAARCYCGGMMYFYSYRFIQHQFNV